MNIKIITDLTPTQAAEFFLKGNSYSDIDLPDYISFEPVLQKVSKILAGGDFSAFQASGPEKLSGVNYIIPFNKDGRITWRPIEIIHPVIYVSLINLICIPENWSFLLSRFKDFEKNCCVRCCSIPVISQNHQSDKAAGVTVWWNMIEQQSLFYSLTYNFIAHTDVADCYGSIYTQSISDALHGGEENLFKIQRDRSLGKGIERHISAGRCGHTIGIPQSPVVMNFFAELVFGYVDELISRELKGYQDFQILRYRDDYRIFTNNNALAEKIIQVISNALRFCGMRLGASKTVSSDNVIESSIKSDKLAAIQLQDMGESNAKTLQKQLLRLHAFGRKFPNSGALRRLITEFYEKLAQEKIHSYEKVPVLVAIATDIAKISPNTWPAIAGIISHLIATFTDKKNKESLWEKVHQKIRTIPHGRYLEIWLQRVARHATINLAYESQEPICQIVNGKKVDLWNNSWIKCETLKSSIDASSIIVKNASETPEKMAPKEVALFKKKEIKKVMLNKKISLKKSPQSAEIHQFSESLKIPYLVHFTKAENISSIIKHGITPSHPRHVVSVSIAFPDSQILSNNQDRTCFDLMEHDSDIKMLETLEFAIKRIEKSCKLARRFKDETTNLKNKAKELKSQVEAIAKSDERRMGWVVLLLKPSILWEKPCLFFKFNADAAPESVNRNDLESAHKFQTLQAFKRMFSEYDENEIPSLKSNTKTREEKCLKEYDPTDESAEVLIPETIEPDYIIGVRFRDLKTMEKYMEKYRHLFDTKDTDFCSIDEDFFTWRECVRKEISIRDLLNLHLASRLRQSASQSKK